ncbi:putative membrane protein YhhN [Streptomyces olivoverticillatus]|uniref:Putative membrane protein YhhN n=1 Tax=Streptomyces olivoverticillatus TaxID=66427 RepID=A0A7W7PKC5_9ACTN|nr:putative membrane protein YhhN [Streptomyces olivoverticillatus]
MKGARALPAAFAAVAGVHLGAILAAAPAVVHVTKPVLMPLLAVCVLVRGAPRLLAVALLLGCAGDTLLQVGGDTAFLLGMGAFAAGHICYLALFARHGRAAAYTHRWAGVYAAAWLGTVVLLWPDLEPGMRVPVALYSLLLTAMALGATRAGALAAAGGVLFLLSDSLLAGGLAGWPQAPRPQFWVMLTYTAAQCLLAAGLLRCREGAAAVPSGPLVARKQQTQSRTAAKASTMPKP